MPKPFINPKIWKQLHEPNQLTYLDVAATMLTLIVPLNWSTLKQIHFQLFLPQDVLQHKINAKETFIVFSKGNMLYSLMSP